MTREWPASDAHAPMHGIFLAWLLSMTLVVAVVVAWLLVAP